MRLAVDTGGTFTDLVMEHEGRLKVFKASTTAHNPVEGILNAIEKAAGAMSITREQLLNQAEMFIHGTTHAINAVITGNTAKTAFLTTNGHPDILVWREGGRIEPFDFSENFPKPYVPRKLTFEVPERITWDGQVLEPLNENAVVDIIHQLKTLQIEAVAVCLLWSTVNGNHEKRIGQLLDQHLSGVPFTLSHVLNPILREYRRASSTCIDASLKPLMTKYLRSLERRLIDEGFKGRLLMLTSKGGVMDMEELSAAPIHAVGSGPSMAPIAGRYFAQVETNTNTAIVADTGGTTYDVSLVRNGVIPMTPDTWIGQQIRGHIVGFPAVDVKSIGAGGGSIAWIDKGGLLHVGPQSAGAIPGPACYGNGGEHPTVTDAALVLGYIDPDFFLGGAMELDLENSQRVIKENIGEVLNLDLYNAASAIMRLATENMVSAIEQITIQQGIDPRHAVLIGAGGAAGLNSIAIARRLGCQTVIIPEIGATFSAYGALISDLHADYRTLFYTTTDRFDLEGVNKVLNNLLTRCQAFIDGSGEGALESWIELFAEGRYKDQVWEIDVPLPDRLLNDQEDISLLRETFDKCHEELFAFRDPESIVQFVGWRATVHCRISDEMVGRIDKNPKTEYEELNERDVYFENLGITKSRVVMFGSSSPGESIEGPAIIESPYSSIVIEPNSRAVFTDNGSVLITTDIV